MLTDGPEYETTELVLPKCDPPPAVIATPSVLPVPRIIMHMIAVLDVQPDASHPVCPIVDAIVSIHCLKLDPWRVILVDPVAGTFGYLTTNGDIAGVSVVNILVAVDLNLAIVNDTLAVVVEDAVA